MKKLTSKQQKWADIIAAWSESGLTQADYCRREQIDIKRFYLWKSKLKSLHVQPSAAGEFLPIMSQTCGSSDALRIRIGVAEIEYRHDTDPVLLLKVLELLGQPQ